MSLKIFFVAVMIQICSTFFLSIQSHPGKKTRSINALIGVPMPEKDREPSLSSSSSMLSSTAMPKKTNKEPTIDFNRIPSPPDVAKDLQGVERVEPDSRLTKVFLVLRL